MSIFKHSQITINGVVTHVIQVGNKEKQPILFLHGYPENWKAYSQVMEQLKDDFYLVSLDLPGIGKTDPIRSNDKRSIAKFINDLILNLKLSNLVIVGQDVGGMVAFALVRNFPDKISKVVIMNTAIPGIAPWEEVKRNPYLWHFAFFSIPELPEKVFDGKQDLLFNFFFDTISFNKDVFDEKRKKMYISAYQSINSLKTSFEWYRAFTSDEKENSKSILVEIPFLYLRGAMEYGDINKYLEGFKDSGIKYIQGGLIPKSGHYTADESPKEVAKAIENFIRD